MVGSHATLKTAAPRAIHAPRTASRAQVPQRVTKDRKRLGDSRAISSGFCAEFPGKFLKSGINFGNFDALEARLQGIVMILIRGRQNTPGVPDDADMISFRQPEFSRRPAKRDQRYFQGVRQMQRRSVDRNDAVQLLQAGDEIFHGFSRTGHKSPPHLFGKLGAQRLLQAGHAIILAHKHDFKTGVLENKFRQLEPASIRPLEFGKPTPAAPRKKTDPTARPAPGYHRTGHGQGHVRAFHPFGMLEKFRGLGQMTIENITSPGRSKNVRIVEIKINDVGQGSQFF